MPLTIRSNCCFPVHCAVTYNAALFVKLPLTYCSGFWSPRGQGRLKLSLLITLLLSSSVPAYSEWVPVGGNHQVGMAVAQQSLTRVIDPKPAAVVPVQRTESWWTTQHEQTLARIRQGAVDLLFIGDSITQRWANEGHHIWDAYYGRRHAVNLGFKGDCTEHVLWRLDHGEIDEIEPKLVVVMIGTNNTGKRHDPPEETAAGIQAILTILRTRVPNTKILLLGVFPRSASADDPLRRLNVAINDRLRNYGDSQQVFFLDLSPRFLDDWGHLSQDLMPDYLHLSERGYQVWADGMEDMIRQLLSE
jgi:lysophospholipase L1-like esterase